MFAVKFFFSSVFSEKSLDCYMLEKGHPYQVSPFFIYSTCKYNLPFERLPSKKNCSFRSMILHFRVQQVRFNHAPPSFMNRKSARFEKILHSFPARCARHIRAHACARR